MGLLYEKEGKIFCNNYCEIYIPISYFKSKYSMNSGSFVNTIGIFYIRSFPGEGREESIQLFSIPAIINVMVYDFIYEDVKIDGKSTPVMTLKYLKDSYIMQSSVQSGREVAEVFLNYMLNGKLPNTLDYSTIINMWWRNLEIAGVQFRVPSKILEMIIASIYRDPRDTKKRFGEVYGKQTNPDGHNYDTGSVIDVVEGLSTFSGMVFENIDRMITSGINNSLEGIEEPVSPMEKVIYY